MLTRNFTETFGIAIVAIIFVFCASNLSAMGDKSEAAKKGIESMVK